MNDTGYYPNIKSSVAFQTTPLRREGFLFNFYQKETLFVVIEMQCAYQTRLFFNLENSFQFYLCQSKKLCSISSNHCLNN